MSIVPAGTGGKPERRRDFETLAGTRPCPSDRRHGYLRPPVKNGVWRLNEPPRAATPQRHAVMMLERGLNRANRTGTSESRR
jgi:hypothetical protein